jgi:hypothetical protein
MRIGELTTVQGLHCCENAPRVYLRHTFENLKR